jgi:cell division protein FtsL
MANLQKFVVVLLVLTIVLSAVSVVFNLIIFKMSSENNHVVKEIQSSNVGNVGLVVEG